MTYRGQDIYAKDVSVIDLRERIGMVFQAPNFVADSIYDNVAYGPRLKGYRGGDLDERVRYSLQKAALWNEVKDHLRKNAGYLSGGQQQRLCIARALANNPDVLLMDEPCSALHPMATDKIENLIKELVQERTVIMVTHNIEQARRIADWVAFMHFDGSTGYLHHFRDAHDTFINPKDRVLEDFVTLRVGKGSAVRELTDVKP